jgi:hypothetical protein
MKYCVACDAEYTDWITTCSDCGEPLAATGDDEEPERIVYEVGTWPLALQAAAAQAMAESGIPHAWVGADLAIEEAYEDKVDALLDEVEKGADVTGDDIDGEMSYELDDWTEDQRIELRQGLLDNSVPHRWEGDILVVAIADEDTVDSILDQAEFSDNQTEMSPEIMSDLFVAADKLRRSANDGGSMASLADHLETMSPLRPPFGVERLVWKKIVDSSSMLSDTICDERSTDDAIRSKAGELRDLLHPYV